jgi:hypothetical protein
MLFTGSVVVACSLVRQLLVVVVCLKFTSLGPWGCSWACSCFLAGLLLVVFFCLLQLCKVGVLRQQLELVFFLGALRCSSLAPPSGPVVLLFVVSGKVEI